MPNLTKTILEDASAVISRVDLSPLAGKSVSVTGATGVIGTYVLACLALYGKCKAVHPVASKRPEPGHPALEFTNRSWTYVDLARPEGQATISPAEYLLFAAGYGQPAKFMAKPLDTISINTRGLFSALQSLQNGRLLYVSSSEVYSGNPYPPYHEESYGATTPQHPRACYIEAKRCGEAICHSYNRGYYSTHYNAKAVAARVALSYGPGTRKDDDRAINQFIRQALLNGEIRLLDAGSAIRTYCYVADCVEQLFNVWLYGTQEVYNVGGISRLTILELAEMIGAYCKVPVWAPAPMVVDDTSAPQIVSMSLERINREFGFKDRIPMDVGLARTIEWQKELYARL
jgi:UDP-glucuronate decarboxylase